MAEVRGRGDGVVVVVSESLSPEKNGDARNRKKSRKQGPLLFSPFSPLILVELANQAPRLSRISSALGNEQGGLTNRRLDVRRFRRDSSSKRDRRPRAKSVGRSSSKQRRSPLSEKGKRNDGLFFSSVVN